MRAHRLKDEMTRTTRILGTTAAIVIAATMAAAAAAWMGLRGSLPVIDGTAPVTGLGANVLVERDAAVVPHITARRPAGHVTALAVDLTDVPEIPTQIP